MAEHPAQARAVGRDDPIERALGPPVEPALPLGGVWRSSRAHIIGVRVSDTTAGDEDRDAEGDRELAEEAAHHVGHEQQRDEHRDQRDGERQDGEADLLGAFERRL